MEALFWPPQAHRHSHSVSTHPTHIMKKKIIKINLKKQEKRKKGQAWGRLVTPAVGRGRQKDLSQLLASQAYRPVGDPISKKRTVETGEMARL